MTALIRWFRSPKVGVVSFRVRKQMSYSASLSSTCKGRRRDGVELCPNQNMRGYMHNSLAGASSHVGPCKTHRRLTQGGQLTRSPTSLAVCCWMRCFESTHHALVGILHQLVHRQRRIVGLHHRVRNLRDSSTVSLSKDE